MKSRGYKVDPATEHPYRKPIADVCCIDCGMRYDGAGHVIARRRAAGKSEAEIYHMLGALDPRSSANG